MSRPDILGGRSGGGGSDDTELTTYAGTGGAAAAAAAAAVAEAEVQAAASLRTVSATSSDVSVRGDSDDSSGSQDELVPTAAEFEQKILRFSQAPGAAVVFAAAATAPAILNFTRDELIGSHEVEQGLFHLAEMLYVAKQRPNQDSYNRLRTFVNHTANDSLWAQIMRVEYPHLQHWRTLYPHQLTGATPLPNSHFKVISNAEVVLGQACYQWQVRPDYNRIIGIDVLIHHIDDSSNDYDMLKQRFIVFHHDWHDDAGEIRRLCRKHFGKNKQATFDRAQLRADLLELQQNFIDDLSPDTVRAMHMGEFFGNARCAYFLIYLDIHQLRVARLSNTEVAPDVLVRLMTRGNRVQRDCWGVGHSLQVEVLINVADYLLNTQTFQVQAMGGLMRLLEQARSDNPDDRAVVFEQLTKMEFRNRLYLQAYQTALECRALMPYCVNQWMNYRLFATGQDAEQHAHDYCRRKQQAVQSRLGNAFAQQLFRMRPTVRNFLLAPVSVGASEPRGFSKV